MMKMGAEDVRLCQQEECAAQRRQVEVDRRQREEDRKQASAVLMHCLAAATRALTVSVTVHSQKKMISKMMLITK